MTSSFRSHCKYIRSQFIVCSSFWFDYLKSEVLCPNNNQLCPLNRNRLYVHTSKSMKLMQPLLWINCMIHKFLLTESWMTTNTLSCRLHFWKGKKIRIKIRVWINFKHQRNNWVFKNVLKCLNPRMIMLLKRKLIALDNAVVNLVEISSFCRLLISA